MVQSKTQFEKVIDRTIQGKAPAAVILDNKDTPFSYVSETLCSEYQSAFDNAKIIPIRFDCTKHQDSLSIWKGMAICIKEGLSFVDDPIATKKWQRLDKNSESTEDIKMNLISILEYTQKNYEYVVLLFLEGFENAIERMEDFDILKFRDMTRTIRLLTITHISLVEAGMAKYGSTYFCNQFMPYTIL